MKPSTQELYPFSFFKKVFSSQENVHSSVSARRGQLVQQEEQTGPPKPPRSAFMCFTDAKKLEVLGSKIATEDKEVLKIVAVEWRQLSDRDRAYWDEEARNDKVR